MNINRSLRKITSKVIKVLWIYPFYWTGVYSYPFQGVMGKYNRKQLILKTIYSQHMLDLNSVGTEHMFKCCFM